MPVKTTRVKNRRDLCFASYDELLADAESITSGPFKTLGNWSAGQIFRHLAIVYTSSIDGFKMSFPWYLRLPTWLLRNQLIRGKMPPGFKLPAGGEEAIVPGPTSIEDGLADLRKAVSRLNNESQRASHPAFGRLSNEQWDKLHLAHAGMHLSFLVRA